MRNGVRVGALFPVRRVLAVTAILCAGLVSRVSAADDEDPGGSDVPPVSKTDILNGVSLYNKGEYREAYEAFSRLSSRGDPVARVLLARLLFRGEGVPEDDERAARLAEQAVDGVRERARSEDDVAAWHCLGYLYLLGEGIDASHRNAKQWLTRAVDRNYLPAMEDVAWIHAYCNGECKDVDRAVALWNKAGEHGYAAAYLAQGNAFRDGDGIPRDYVKARQSFQKGADADNADCMFELASLLRRGLGGEKDFKEAAKLYRRGAHLKHLKCTRMLGVVYERGQGVAVDYEAAMTWYRKAAKQDDTYAIYSIARMYDLGRGVAKDFKKSFEWYMKGARLDDKDCVFAVGYAYFHGEGVKKNTRRALSWYRKGAGLGSVESMHNLAYIYHHGEGVAKNYRTAKLWYEKGAAEGDADSMYGLGILYHLGQGVRKNRKQAIRWLEKAQNKGHKKARALLRKVRGT